MKDSKNIYEFLNQIYFDIEDYEREQLNDIEKQNFKKTFRKNIKRKFNLKKLGNIAAVLILSIGALSQTDFGKNVYAITESKISEISSYIISYSIENTLGVRKNIESYSNAVNQIVKHNGIGIKLTDVFIDKDELILCIFLNANEPIENSILTRHIFINGKKVNPPVISSRVTKIVNYKTMAKVEFINIKNIELKEDINIKVIFDNLQYSTGDSKKEIEGKWEFEFTANGKNLLENTHTSALDYSFYIDNKKYMLEEFRYNPVNQKIHGKRRIKDRYESIGYNIELRGNDNLGNQVEFHLLPLSDAEEDLVFKYQNLFRDLSDEITSITLTPYAAKYSGEIRRNDWKQVGEEFTIFLNK
ncbi:DUF5643 domain-containing protein [Tissierella praeacuta]|uniref:DUF5643 domain-containing protein n=1 Tax=Tissierella praeacuta TaxID=43131 RepID=UPI003341E025